MYELKLHFHGVEAGHQAVPIAYYRIDGPDKIIWTICPGTSKAISINKTFWATAEKDTGRRINCITLGVVNGDERARMFRPSDLPEFDGKVENRVPDYRPKSNTKDSLSDHFPLFPVRRADP